VETTARVGPCTGADLRRRDAVDSVEAQGLPYKAEVAGSRPAAPTTPEVCQVCPAINRLNWTFRPWVRHRAQNTGARLDHPGDRPRRTWCFQAPGGGPLRINNFRHRMWSPALRASSLEGFAAMTSGTLPSPGGSTPPPRPNMCRPGPGTSIRTTYDVYGHLFPDSEHRVMDALEGSRTTTENPARPLR